jgi:hypothetical protein
MGLVSSNSGATIGVQPPLCRRSDATETLHRRNHDSSGHGLAALHAVYSGQYGTALAYAGSANLGRAVDLFSSSGNKKRAVASWLW